MKIMTFNVQHFANYYNGNKIDYEVYEKTLKESDWDILGFNEIRSEGPYPGYEKQTEIMAERVGVEHYFFAEATKIYGENSYGNAMFSKIPIIKKEVIHIPDPEVQTGERDYETRCILKAKLEGEITVLVTHFGLNPDEHENAVKTVMEHICPEKCILMGDFNVNPDSKLLLPIREKMKDTADVFSEPLYSWPRENPRRKIDYIFVSPDIEVVSADIPAIGHSDHRPHTAEIKL